MPKQKKSTQFKRIRFVISDDTTHNSLFVYRGSRKTILTTIASAVVLFIALLTSLILFTPVKRLAPGYPSNETVIEALENARKLDSLEKQVRVWAMQFSNIQKVLAGEPVQRLDSLFKVNTPLDREVVQERQYAKEDSIIRDVVANYDRYSLSADAEISDMVDDIVLFPPVKGIVSQAYNEGSSHPYVDIAVEENTTAFSVAQGVVVSAMWTDEVGFVCHIQHPNGLLSVYKHLTKLLVEVGDRVIAGAPIAQVGDVGTLSTGPHLHLELWSEGEPLDPAQYIENLSYKY